MGWDWTLTGVNPSSDHSEGREILKQSLSSTALSQHDPVLVSELKDLILSIRRLSTKSMRQYSGHSDFPATLKLSIESMNPLATINHAVASVIIRIAYGDGVFGDIGEQ